MAGLGLGEPAADRGRSRDGLFEDVGVALDCEGTLRGNGEPGSRGEAIVDMAVAKLVGSTIQVQLLGSCGRC